MIEKVLFIFFLIILIPFGGCFSDNQKAEEILLPDLTLITDEGLDRISGKKILFGHKSVGKNIISGIRSLQKIDPRFQKIQLAEYHPGETINSPGFYHLTNGKNNFPKSKCDNFSYILDTNRTGNKLDIAFFKFCYVDIGKESDIHSIFEYYYNKIKHIEEKYPELVLVHVTCPLRAHAFGLKGKVSDLFRTDIANIKRNQYNTLLRSGNFKHRHYFDLAELESTLPDGGRAFFTFENREYYSLATLYTDDGGHLNNIGQIKAAFYLVNLLTEITTETSDI